MNLNSSWSDNFVELNSHNKLIIPQKTRPVRLAATPGVPPKKLQTTLPLRADPNFYASRILSDFSKLTVAKLKAELKKRELPTDGKKSNLVARLEEDQRWDDWKRLAI